MNSAAEQWHILQFSDALDFEFASALARYVPVTLWRPLHQTPLLGRKEQAGNEPNAAAPGVHVATFSLMRGFARLPLPVLNRLAPALMEQLLRQTSDPQCSVLVCTTPFFAPVAERWPGTVVYWLSDLIALYRRSASVKVRRLDERMCHAATLVCPNSQRIASYLLHEAGCPPDRCRVLPNATGTQSLLPAPLAGATPLPEPYRDLPRPVAGVIGNLADNTDWTFLEQVVQRTPWLSWLFVGPATRAIADRAERLAREHLKQHPRCFFIGPKPYTELYRFARGVDVAVLPYRRREPTYSGSSTRFYDHLAAGHPIVATTGVASLHDLTPYLTLVNSASEAVQRLEELRAMNFQDGLREARWEASQQNTWQSRAETLLAELAQRRA